MRHDYHTNLKGLIAEKNVRDSPSTSGGEKTLRRRHAEKRGAIRVARNSALSRNARWNCRSIIKSIRSLKRRLQFTRPVSAPESIYRTCVCARRDSPFPRASSAPMQRERRPSHPLVNSNEWHSSAKLFSSATYWHSLCTSTRNCYRLAPPRPIKSRSPSSRGSWGFRGRFFDDSLTFLANGSGKWTFFFLDGSIGSRWDDFDPFWKDIM